MQWLGWWAVQHLSGQFSFHLLCFKVSAPGISLFNLQLRAISEEIPEEEEKKKKEHYHLNRSKWVVLRSWDVTGSCRVEVDNQQSHFLSMACSAGALGAATVGIRMQRNNV